MIDLLAPTNRPGVSQAHSRGTQFCVPFSLTPVRRFPASGTLWDRVKTAVRAHFAGSRKVEARGRIWNATLGCPLTGHPFASGTRRGSAVATPSRRMGSAVPRPSRSRDGVSSAEGKGCADCADPLRGHELVSSRWTRGVAFETRSFLVTRGMRASRSHLRCDRVQGSDFRSNPEH